MTKTPTIFSLNSQSISDVGLTRQQNEDTLIHEPDIGLFAVFDGMGGHEGGEVASHMAATIVERLVREKAHAKIFSRTYQRSRYIEHVMNEAMGLACESIYNTSKKHQLEKGMGTTASVMLIHERKVTIAHVGDSRIYLLRGQSKIRLTEDHTLAQSMVESGALTAEEAIRSKYSNHLTRVLGIQPHVQIDVATYDVMPGDRFIVCSDGLTRYEQQGQPALPPQLTGVPEDLIETFRAWSHTHGAKDNMTAVVVDVAPNLDSNITLIPSYQQMPVDEALKTIKHIVLFKHLNEREMMTILDRCEHRHLLEGERVFEEHQAGEDLFMILGGELQIEKDNHILATLSDGDHFGEMALIGEYPRSATAHVTKDLTVLSLKRSDFYDLLQTNAQLARKLLWNFLWMQSRRLRSTSNQPAQLPFLSPQHASTEIDQPIVQ